MKSILQYKRYTQKFLLSLLGLLSLSTVAQNFGFKRFSTADGLMSNQIDALFIDSKNLLWIANGNGITRFNGKHFANYLNDSMLTVVNKINNFSIRELKDGSIFYSMKYGYVKTSAHKRFYLDIYLSDTLALEDEEGVTDKNGIRYFKKGIVDFDFSRLKVINRPFQSYPEGRTFPSNLLGSNKGHVFYSFYNKETDTRTLFLYENNTFKKIYDGIPFIMAGIFETNNHYFILPDDFTEAHPIILVNKYSLLKSFIYKNKHIPDLHLMGNALLYQGQLFCPAREGIWILDANKTQRFAEDKISKGLAPSQEEGGFYSSLSKPLYLYQHYLVNGYRLLDIEQHKIIVPAILEQQMKQNNWITEALPDKEGNIWVATTNGLFQLFLMPYEYVSTITESRIGEVNDSIENNRFQCIYKTNDAEYCMSNDPENIQIIIPSVKDKFYKYDKTTKQVSPIFVQGIQSPILKERLYPILSYKKLLICQEYTRGLVIYHLNNAIDTAYYHLFNYSKGLISHYVENVFADKKENIWLITWDGIQLIPYNNLLNEDYEQSIKYSQSLKLEMIPFMKDDVIYFADGQLLYKIPTATFLYNKKPPELLIEKLLYKHRNKSYELFFKQDSTYQIPYDFDELQVEFFGVCLSDGSKVRYKYVLDNTPHFQTEGRLLLTDLAPGTHIIELYAANNFNVWNPNPVRLVIEVLPPFWQKWWFRTLVVILLAGSVFLIIKTREYHLKQKQKELEQLVKIRTKELEEKTQLVEQKNAEILDSIQYTKRLQQSSLPSESQFKKIFPDSFILYLPKDIIAGDFYFSGVIQTNDGKLLKGLVVGDCTGHGVPGAFMSILLLAHIKQSLKEKDVNSPAEALEFISSKIQKVLEYKNEKDEVKDSADMVFAVINDETKTLWCACANNPVYIVRHSQLMEVPAQKRTVGYCDNTEPFINHTIPLQKNDMLYFFSDGYADQFGGLTDENNKKNKDKKFTKKRFKETLIKAASLEPAQQKEFLLRTHLEWKGNSEQTDDICIIGIRV